MNIHTGWHRCITSATVESLNNEDLLLLSEIRRQWKGFMFNAHSLLSENVKSYGAHNVLLTDLAQHPDKLSDIMGCLNNILKNY
jgi:hypothetical protein